MERINNMTQANLQKIIDSDIHGLLNERTNEQIRLEELRTLIIEERISQGEIAELQGLAEYIEPGDVQLLEWAGVPEHGTHNGAWCDKYKAQVLPDEDGNCSLCGATLTPEDEFKSIEHYKNMAEKPRTENVNQKITVPVSSNDLEEMMDWLQNGTGETFNWTFPDQNCVSIDVELVPTDDEMEDEE
jgi:hypothetical protein